jgi:hypothetical protein
MGKIVKRIIEKYNDGLNTTYFLHGDKPLPKMLIDEIENCIYITLGYNSFNERMYVRIEPNGGKKEIINDGNRTF